MFPLHLKLRQRKCRPINPQFLGLLISVLQKIQILIRVLKTFTGYYPNPFFDAPIVERKEYPSSGLTHCTHFTTLFAPQSLIDVIII